MRSGTRGAGSLPLALAVVTVCAVYLCAPARGKTAETRAKPSAPESMVQYCARYMPGGRGKGEPDTGTNHTGFRCVRDAEPAAPAK